MAESNSRRGAACHGRHQRVERDTPMGAVPPLTTLLPTVGER